LGAGLWLWKVNAHAAAPSGIAVSPAFQQVSIPQGKPSVPIKFTITNHESRAETINLSTQDFNTLGETGGLVFVGSNPTQLQKKYGLAKWLSLPQNRLTLQPSQTATVNASIINLPSLNPGGHYGALMLSLSNGGQSASGVSLHPIASSLLFVTKIGGDTHKLALVNVETKHTLFSLPGSATLRFHNDGNTHVVPRGLVTVVGAHGQIVSKGIINQNSDIILPETYRRLDVPLQTVNGAFGIGEYKLVVDFRFDGFNQYRRYQASFWLVPWYLFVLVGVLIVVAIGTFSYRRKRKEK
jgi:hypothetical protein